MNKLIEKISELKFDLEVENHIKNYILSKCKNDDEFEEFINDTENYNFEKIKIPDCNFLDFFESYIQEINIFLSNEVRQMSVKSIFEIINLNIDDQLFIEKENRTTIAKFVFVQICLNIYDEITN